MSINGPNVAYTNQVFILTNNFENFISEQDNKLSYRNGTNLYRIEMDRKRSGLKVCLV